MPRRAATGCVFALTAVVLAAATPATAVVYGTPSSLGAYTVRLIGNGYCTGVVIARRTVVTAAHCGRRMRVLTRGGSYRIVGVSRSAVLDDGRRVHVSGDAAILRLDRALPYGVSAAPVGAGGGDTFTIAGYGTTDERARGAFGSLHEARLVAASSRALVDPNRSGSIGASACFGDSGGPVMRGGMLVGIVTRAAHPSPRRACGHLTRWTPITVRGSPSAVASRSDDQAEPAPRRVRRQRQARRTQESETAAPNLFASWFTVKAEPHCKSARRKSARHKSARHKAARRQ